MRACRPCRDDGEWRDEKGRFRAREDEQRADETDLHCARARACGAACTALSESGTSASAMADANAVSIPLNQLQSSTPTAITIGAARGAPSERIDTHHRDDRRACDHRRPNAERERSKPHGVAEREHERIER